MRSTDPALWYVDWRLSICIITIELNFSPKEEYDENCRVKISQMDQSRTDEPLNKPSLADRSEDTPLQSKQIGPYRTAVFHEHGLFSTVYRARDPSGNVVALKVTTPSQMTAPHNSIREARILERAAHKDIIPLLSTFRQAGGRFVLVFPFLPMDLNCYLRRHSTSPSHIKSHLYSIFSALSYLHSLGIVHRDIKPSNILLASPAGPAYLVDFGIAWMPGDAASEPADRKIIDVGTTSYRPPELLFGSTHYGSSLDLWAAGCVVAEAVMSHEGTLFDSGPLGSDLALIQSIFKTLGTPTSETWPVRLQAELLEQYT
ncbi:hypothetical protein MMC12_006631 [Toensbergia leucococca]|nr:hypothetical protein [Toensbergia leucococca]